MTATFIIGPDDNADRILGWLLELGLDGVQEISRGIPPKGDLVIVGQGLQQSRSKTGAWGNLWNNLETLSVNGRILFLPHPDPRNKFWQNAEQKRRAIRALRAFME